MEEEDGTEQWTRAGRGPGVGGGRSVEPPPAQAFENSIKCLHSEIG